MTEVVRTRRELRLRSLRQGFELDLGREAVVEAHINEDIICTEFESVFDSNNFEFFRVVFTVSLHLFKYFENFSLF